MAVEEVEVYEYEGGVCVDPKSDIKVVFIPSPPDEDGAEDQPASGHHPVCAFLPRGAFLCVGAVGGPTYRLPI